MENTRNENKDSKENKDTQINQTEQGEQGEIKASKKEVNKTGFSKRPKTNNKFIQEAITNFKLNDDMIALTTLYNLTSQLSMANDTLADDPNCSVLIQELISLFDKYFIPDITLYSLQCINYLLDLNPSFSNPIRNFGGMNKIVQMTQNIEFIDLAENAIKAIEKMSIENSYFLLECDAFSSVLNLIVFFDNSFKKSAVMACLNMSATINSIDLYNKFIQSAIPSLTQLTKLEENDIQVVSNAILCFMYLISNMKVFNWHNVDNQIENSILQYGMHENLYEILLSYINNKNEKKIPVEICKNIFKIFKNLLAISNEAADLLLNMNILEIVYNVLNDEFGDSQDENVINSINNSGSSFLADIFPLLLELFPKIENITKDNNTVQLIKIMSKSNLNFYNFFSEKIIKLLVSHVINISSCGTLLQVVKLLNVFAYYSNEEQILNYLEQIKISHIIGKLIDTKDNYYFQEVLTLLEIIMEKVPQYYIVSFVREGIVENLKNFKIDVEKYKNVTNLKKIKYNKIMEEKINPPVDNIIDKKESEIIIENEVGVVGEENILIKEKLNEEIEKEENEYDEYSDEEKYNEEEDPYYDQDYPEDEIMDEAVYNEELKKALELSNVINENENTNLQTENINKNVININNNIKDQILIKKEEHDKFIIENNISNKTYPQNFLNISKESNLLNKIENPIYHKELNLLISLEKRLSEFKEKYLTDEMIKNYLNKIDITENPTTILNTLETLKSEILQSISDNKININSIKKLVEILIKKENKLTLWEIERSGILLVLCKFFDKNFIENYNNIKETENSNFSINDKKEKEIINNLIYEPSDFFENIKTFLNCFNNKNEILEFINLIQYTITSMNCFVVYFHETNINNYNYGFNYNNQNKIQDLEKKFKIRLNYSNENIKNVLEALVDNQNELNRVSIINDLYSKQKQMVIYLSQNETFQNLEKILIDDLSLFNINKKNEVNLKVVINFFIRFESNSIEKIFIINKNWTALKISEELKKKYTKEELKNLPLDMPINYEIELEKINSNLEEINNTNNVKISELNNPISELKNNLKLENLYSKIDLFNLHTTTRDTHKILDQKLFEKYYLKNIILNSSLYEIKRLSPSLFIISTLELILNKFSHLFNIKNIQEENKSNLNENNFQNTKVSNLLTKQMRDSTSISIGSIPSWCKNLTQNFTNLADFNSRFILFKVSSFDSSRGLINLHNYLKNFSSESNKINISKSRRNKVIVEREEILNYAFKLMQENSNFNGYLEFEYLNETGSGTGPTLEFYSLVIEKLKENKNLWYKTTDNSLFPVGRNNEENRKMFALLGFIIARGLYDDRLIDVPLNSLFWDLVLDKPIGFDSISQIDKDLGKTLINDFLKIISEKFSFLEKNPQFINDDSFDLGEEIKYNNMRIDEIGILFNLPGYPELELIKNGLETLLTIYNIEEYTLAIFNKLFGKGIQPLLDSFKEGFNLVFDIRNLKCFNSEEIEDSLLGCKEDKWEFDVIYDSVKPDHGYDKNSKTFKFLIKFMSELDSKEKKKFLLFVTGTPRLPLGGFKNLSPKLTVVKKTLSVNLENPDDFLATVMTCQNYLKIPDYSNFEIFKERLFTAINEGSNAFHLS